MGAVTLLQVIGRTHHLHCGIQHHMLDSSLSSIHVVFHRICSFFILSVLLPGPVLPFSLHAPPLSECNYPATSMKSANSGFHTRFYA